MSLLPIIGRALWVAAATLGVNSAFAQNYPNKPIRIVTSPIGSGTDFAARTIAQGLTANLGQQVIVDNRPSGVIPGQLVAIAPADGYTLLASGSTLWMGPLIQKTPYDVVKDFSPVSLVTRAPMVIVVHPSLPVKTIKELVALAKARPGELNYSSGSTGTLSHLSAEQFKALAGVDVVRIVYQGGGTQMADLLSGQVQMTFGPPVEMMPHVKAGKLRALASTGVQPSPLLPGLPTIAASGVPGYESTSMQGIFAPAKTPIAIVNRVSEQIVRFLSTPEARQRLLDSGVEAVGSSPGELDATIKSEIARGAKLINQTGIR